ARYSSAPSELPGAPRTLRPMRRIGFGTSFLMLNATAFPSWRSGSADQFRWTAGHEILHELELHQESLHALYVQTFRIRRSVVLGQSDLRLPFLHELAIVDVPKVRRDAEIAFEVLGVGPLLSPQQRFVVLLAMPGSNHVDRMALLPENVEQRMGEYLERRRGCLLHENVAGPAVVEREQNEIDSVVQRHHEARH